MPPLAEERASTLLDLYLRELQREFTHTLPAEDVQVRLAEAEAHLREGVEARVELGMPLAEAEREAVETFGRPVALGRAERPSVLPRLALMLAGYGAGVVTFFAGWWTVQLGIGPMIVGLLLVWSTLAVTFAVHAFRARRPRPLAIFAVGCAASFAATLVIGTTTVFRTGAGVLPKWRVAADRADLLQDLDGRLAEGDVLRRDHQRLEEPAGIESFHGLQGYRVPVPASASHRGSRLSEHDVDSAAWAKDDVRNAWRENATEVRRLRDDIAELDAGMAHPIQNLKAIAPEIVTLNVAAALWIAFADLVFGGFGILVFRIRRRRRVPLA